MTQQAWDELTSTVSLFLPPFADEGDFDRDEMWANVRRWGHPIGHAGRIVDHDPSEVFDLLLAVHLVTSRLLSDRDATAKLEDYGDYLCSWVNGLDVSHLISYLDENGWRSFLGGRFPRKRQAKYTYG